MSVHAQVPLGGSRVEMLSSPDIDTAVPNGSNAPLGTTYRSGPHPAPRPVSASGQSSPLQSAERAVRPPDRLADARAPTQRAARQTPVSRAQERAATLPQPLLAEAPAPAVMPLASAPLTNVSHDGDSRIRPDAHHGSTEVHVHIGRIEVIAAPEPAAMTTPRVPTPRQTVPLAEYLARGRTS